MKTQRFLLALFFIGASFFASYASAQAANNTYPLSTFRNVTTILPGEVIKTPGAGWTAPIGPNQLLEFTTPQKLTSSNPPIDINVKGKINNASIAKAAGNFLKKTLPPLSIGVAIYDLAKELEFEVENPGGVLAVKKQEYTCGTGVTCSGFIAPGGDPIAFGATPVAAAQVLASQRNPNWQVQYCTARTDSNGYDCFIKKCPNCFITLFTAVTPHTLLGAWTTRPATLDELADAIAVKTEWPNNSAVRRFVEDMLGSGEKLSSDPVSVTGPASTPGTTTVTNNSNGTTTTTTTTNNYTYQGPKVTTNTVTTTVVTNTTTGDEIERTTTTTTPVLPPISESPKPFEMPCGVAGKAPCGVKVDETGVPSSPQSPQSVGDTAIEAEKGKVTTSIEQNKSLSVGDWTWSFQLPTGCSPITLDMMVPVVIDPCKYQSIIHDLMSMVWAAVGFFGLFSILRMGVH